MPDPTLILVALAAAAGTAAAELLLCAWPRRRPRPALASAGWALGVGAGFFLGCWLLGLRPHWPPREDQDRLLLLLLPAVVGVEAAAAFLRRSPWLGWLLRLGVAAAAARVLLHGTSYLCDLAGPGSAEWSAAQAWLILGGLAAALMIVWPALALLAKRQPGRSLPLALALSCAGAALVVMLSGYASGGEAGLPLAAGLAGATAASLLLPGKPDGTGALGVGVVGLFAVLVVGVFFGKLSPALAGLLFGAPLLGWLPELPFVRRLGPRLRGLLRAGLTTAAVVAALTLAQRQFVQDSTRTSPGSTEPTLQDYLDYGK